MTTAANNDEGRFDATRSLRTNAFDSLTSAMMALVIFLGCGVGAMLFLWICDWQFQADPPGAPSVSRVSFAASESDVANSFDEPTADETQYLQESNLKQVLDHLSAVQLTSQKDSLNDSEVGYSGDGKGIRRAGPVVVGDEPDGAGIVPAHERWTLVFLAANELQYAKLLEKLDIELGVFGGGAPGIDYVSGFSSTPTARHSDSPADEKRLYFSWDTNGEVAGGRALRAYERKFVGAAGIVISGRHLVKFLPPALEKQLAKQELEYARSHGRERVEEIVRTVFRISLGGDGFESPVTDQRYRKT